MGRLRRFEGLVSSWVVSCVWLGVASCGGTVSGGSLGAAVASGTAGGDLGGMGGTAGFGPGGFGGFAASGGAAGGGCQMAGAAFSSRLSAQPCVVTVLVSPLPSGVAGYQISCGLEAPITETEALAPLLMMSSINWSTALSESEATTAGLYSFRTSAPVPALSVTSARTGEQLVYLRMSEGTWGLPSAWLPASELDGVCLDASRVPFTVFGPTDGSWNPALVMDELTRRGLFAALGAAFGSGWDEVGLTQISLPTGPAVLVFITVSPRV